MAFRIASSPFTHNQQTTQHIMLLVILACLPGILAQVFFFGFGNLIQIGLASATALITEGVTLSLRRFTVRTTLSDNSALLTAVLLGASLPPLTPWWMVVMATAFAIIIAKQLYGGLGQNPFNPAMIGYVVLLISFPVQMTSWLPPTALQTIPLNFHDAVTMIFTGYTPDGYTMQQLMQNADGVSQATPLDTFKTSLRSGQTATDILQQPIFAHSLSGIGWQWVNIGFLIGGIFLLARGVIRWHIPVSFLLTLICCASLSWAIAPEQFASPGLHLFSGATMLGAFFIATDPVTASTTNRGRLIFGALIGLLVWLIRTYGGYPDGVAFAVLLANITVPLIDYYTKPRAYGHHR
ncbi:electron transport complex subunit RsxD [Pectobacterium cacticida]|uniref:Ion-translocating oxidoreductase complex subunit D n=1 Tax=Pectobacterium cacticida TaxID=69221 RepID=A0ABZ2G7B5_9GAMM|nr:electron transport complex subunit RsxD [Pectobacterium cacticida]UYX05250.1 electron transport complex subunit RsxD [Pectobacterium cacticida]